MLTPSKIAERIEHLCSDKSINVAQMLIAANLDKSVIFRMKSQKSMPSADKVAAIASVLEVPIEFILGLGIFEDWDLILQNRALVLDILSRSMGSLANNMWTHGVNDAMLARLISLFKLNYKMNEFKRPEFETMPLFAIQDTDTNSNNLPKYYSNEIQEVMREFAKLDQKGRRITFATIYDQQNRMKDEKKESGLESSAAMVI
jgi:transcriptional regulator with XRE-family HTH domain